MKFLIFAGGLVFGAVGFWLLIASKHKSMSEHLYQETTHLARKLEIAEKDITTAVQIADPALRLQAYDTALRKLGLEIQLKHNIGRWTVSKTKSPLDDKITIRASLESDSKSPDFQLNPPGRHAKHTGILYFERAGTEITLGFTAPVLEVLRSPKRQAASDSTSPSAARLSATSFLSEENNDPELFADNVSLRFDDDPPIKIGPVRQEAGNKYHFPKDQIPHFVERLGRAERLLIYIHKREFESHEADSIQLFFSTRGFNEII